MTPRKMLLISMKVPISTILNKLLFKKLVVVQKVTIPISKFPLKVMTLSRLYKARGKFRTPKQMIWLLSLEKGLETPLKSKGLEPNKIKNNSSIEKFNEIRRATKSQNKKFKKLSLKLKMLISRNHTRPRNLKRRNKLILPQMTKITSLKTKKLNLITKF